jgi:hypothetical protein
LRRIAKVLSMKHLFRWLDHNPLIAMVAGSAVAFLILYYSRGFL